MASPNTTLTPASELAKKAKTPFPGESDAYRKAREALLAEEIEFRRHSVMLGLSHCCPVKVLQEERDAEAPSRHGTPESASLAVA